MAIFELWLERSFDGKYTAHFDKLPPEKTTSTFASVEMDSQLAAAQSLRDEVRKLMGANDQFRVRARSRIYDNLNEALEDMLRS